MDEECQRNCVAIIKRSMELGINHFETARGYGCSELQYGIALKKCMDEGLFKREDFVLQTKVSPMRKRRRPRRPVRAFSEAHKPERRLPRSDEAGLRGQDAGIHRHARPRGQRPGPHRPLRVPRHQQREEAEAGAGGRLPRGDPRPAEAGHHQALRLLDARHGAPHLQGLLHRRVRLRQPSPPVHRLLHRLRHRRDGRHLPLDRGGARAGHGRLHQ